ncbi:MAG: DNA alkylation repair protein, partial [Paracoccaceae bacterium]
MHQPYLDQLRALADPARAAGMAEYHKVPREYFGLANPQVDALTKEWRAEMDVPRRVKLARELWDTNIYEA